MSCGLVWAERYAWHDIGTVAAHLPAGGWLQPDSAPGDPPEAKRRLRNLLEVSGLLDRLEPIRPRPATRAELERFHTRAYVDRIRRLAARGGGDAGEMTPFGRDSYEIARLAVGGCIEAVEAVVSGRVGRAYALVRPPGHHAEPDRGRGFCIFGNVALAAMHARDALGLERIAIVDFDVHHGNGSQLAFWHDPRVLTISVHQDRNFPLNSGDASELGAGRGRGYNFNVPLPPGCGTPAYELAFDELVVPVLRRFEPELLILACGYDASSLDPYGRMLVHSEGFRSLALKLTRVAAETAGGRIVACQEGGYSTAYTPFCGLAVIEELAGVRTDVQDPFLDELAQTGGQELAPHQRQQIIRLRRVAARIAR